MPLQVIKGASLGNKAEIHNGLSTTGSASLSEIEGDAKLRSWLQTLQAHKQQTQVYRDNVARMKNPSMQEAWYKFLAQQHKIRSEKLKQKLSARDSLSDQRKFGSLR